MENTKNYTHLGGKPRLTVHIENNKIGLVEKWDETFIDNDTNETVVIHRLQEVTEPRIFSMN